MLSIYLNYYFPEFLQLIVLRWWEIVRPPPMNNGHLFKTACTDNEHSLAKAEEPYPLQNVIAYTLFWIILEKSSDDFSEIDLLAQIPSICLRACSNGKDNAMKREK